jgi:hypothetical protein
MNCSENGMVKTTGAVSTGTYYNDRWGVVLSNCGDAVLTSIY